MILDKFLETIEFSGEPSGEELKAYKTDMQSADPDSMRRLVGLGECNCCDYFVPKGNTIVFIEETRLWDSLEKHRNGYPYLTGEDKDRLAKIRIREEMRLKSYGSMLVLCRLERKIPEKEKFFRAEKFEFWLVASPPAIKDVIGDDKSFMDNWMTDIRSMLRGTLGKELLDNVELLTPDLLERRLPRLVPRAD